MRLTNYTDYALRTLMHLAANPDELVTIDSIARTQGIAKNHLTKVVHQLGMQGFVETVRGRNGGLRLGRDPRDIRVGDVVRQTETDMTIATCFDPQDRTCVYSSSCVLKGVLGRAAGAFFDVLDNVTLDTLLPPKPAARAVKLYKAGTVTPGSRGSSRTEG